MRKKKNHQHLFIIHLLKKSQVLVGRTGNFPLKQERINFTSYKDFATHLVDFYICSYIVQDLLSRYGC